MKHRRPEKKHFHASFESRARKSENASFKKYLEYVEEHANDCDDSIIHEGISVTDSSRMGENIILGFENGDAFFLKENALNEMRLMLPDEHCFINVLSGELSTDNEDLNIALVEMTADGVIEIDIPHKGNIIFDPVEVLSRVG